MYYIQNKRVLVGKILKNCSSGVLPNGVNCINLYPVWSNVLGCWSDLTVANGQFCQKVHGGPVWQIWIPYHLLLQIHFAGLMTRNSNFKFKNEFVFYLSIFRTSRVSSCWFLNDFLKSFFKPTLVFWISICTLFNIGMGIFWPFVNGNEI